jgi:ABC-type transport system substrate-binding protein
MIARLLPTRENGDWLVNSDGTMVTTYRLREDARWHEGKPITADDIVFAHQVYSAPDLPAMASSRRWSRVLGALLRKYLSK